MKNLADLADLADMCPTMQYAIYLFVFFGLAYLVTVQYRNYL